MFLNGLWLKKCVINQLIDDFFCLILFLINIKRKKCVTVCEDVTACEDPFSIRYASDPYKTQQMCYKAVDDCLDALKFVPDWCVTNKMIKKLFIALYPSLLNRVLGVLACSRALRIYVLASSRAYVLSVLTCLACLRACVFGVLACSRAWRAFVLACLTYVLVMMRDWHAKHWLLAFLSNYSFYLHKSRFYH